jgi:hypothetical protein
MARQFIRLLADVHCEWEGLSPVYRAYINNELFVERTWIWTDHYLEECFQIEAKPGVYCVQYELVPPHLTTLTVKNLRVDYGPATVKHNVVRILDETV